MKKIMYPLVALAFVFTLQSCKSSKKVVSQSAEEVEVIIPCSGDKYRSDSKFIRANSMGESQDMTLAKKKAKNNALQELASKIQTTVQSVVDNYQNSTETQNGENISKRFEELTREVIDQKLSNYSTACEKLTRTKKGTYRSYLSYEIGVDDLLNPLSDKISQDEVLRIDYNYEKFKKNFEEALNKNK
jgi:hypothetical protein